jgi:hypothetical protein
VVAHASESWLAADPPHSRTLTRAAKWALDHGRPELALRLYEHDPAANRPELECEIQRARGDREAVRAVLNRADAEALGGHARTAEFALFAGSFERAELEASALLFQQESSDLGRILRARARGALGRSREAADDVAAIQDATHRRQLAVELLASLGAPQLADELGRLTPRRDVDAGQAARAK